jgi:endonuclease/exonuclease/phosphatase family metal-dependent hydrolase
LRVLTYNLHHCEGLDGKVDLARLARIVLSSGADMVALQELDRRAERTGKVDQARELAELTGMQMRYGAAMDFQGGQYGQAILCRWPIWRFNVHFLPNPSNREPRIAVSSMIQTSAGYTVRFVGLHLDAAREDETRWLQVNRLQEVFGSDDSLPTILAGDFNDLPESRSMVRMFRDWADTSFGNPQPTSPANAPQQRIDYVLLRPKQWGVVKSEVLDEPVASDHRPLLVTLQMPPR